MTPQEQIDKLSQLHELSGQIEALEKQANNIRRESQEISRELLSHLPVGQWMQVNGDLIAYVQDLDDWKGCDRTQSRISFSTIKRLDAATSH